MTDMELFQSLRQMLPHKTAEIALAERDLRNGDVRSAKIRLSDVLVGEIRRIKRYEDSGRMAASIEMLHVARVKVLKGNFGSSWGRLRPQLKGYWIQAGKDLKWVDKGMSAIRGLLFVFGRGNPTAQKTRVYAWVVQSLMKPYTVAIDVLTHSSARKDLLNALGDLSRLGRAKAAQLMDKARPFAQRGITAGKQMVRATVSSVRSAGVAVVGRVKTGLRKVVGFLGL